MIELSLVFGVYVITLALTESSGPFGLLEKLRSIDIVERSGLLECYLCTSFWVSVALCVAFNRIDMILISWGVSTLIQRLYNAYTLR